MNTVLHPCVTNPAGATTVIAATATGRSPIETPLTTAAAFAAVQARTVRSTADPIMRVARDTATLLHMKTTEATAAATAMNLARQGPLSLPAKALPAITATKTADSIGPIFSVPRKRTTDLTI